MSDMSHPLSDSQLNALGIIERICSSLSLAGCLITIVSFALSDKFRKPINRLVFYATFGNMLTNVATLMAGAYSSSPNSGLCQFQAFLIQMFMPAGAYWTLAMAINVHLTFYNHFDAHKLRAIELPYVILCYGIPFIPALVFLFVRNDNGHRPYGIATLWCWLTPEWNVNRIAVFYAPVWLTIITTVAIYGRAGRMIFRIRKQLQNFRSSNFDTDYAAPTIKPTEVLVISKAASKAVPPIPSPPISPTNTHADGQLAYTVSVSADPPPTLANFICEAAIVDSQPIGIKPIEQFPIDPILSTIHQYRHHNYNHYIPHPYLPHPHLPHFHLHSHSHIHLRHRRTPSTAERHSTHALNKAAWSYTKCAMLFFTAMLVTWIPSSANRVYSYTHNDQSSVALEFMSAFVLPLQGLWNFAIYAVFSWDAFKDLWHDGQEWIAGDEERRTTRLNSWQGNGVFWRVRKPSDSDSANGDVSIRRPSDPESQA